ncbi:hypothetical protein PLESTF_001663200 [Pleodorina starrii]|nr:hypothetical protein PLESTM_000353000 [Pleodorina starrii]GLC75594.1 hypothetical protein PLESTF_001663200 [Pleodorina starrii]
MMREAASAKSRRSAECEAAVVVSSRQHLPSDCGTAISGSLDCSPSSSLSRGSSLPYSSSAGIASRNNTSIASSPLLATALSRCFVAASSPSTTCQPSHASSPPKSARPTDDDFLPPTSSLTSSSGVTTSAKAEPLQRPSWAVPQADVNKLLVQLNTPYTEVPLDEGCPFVVRQEMYEIFPMREQHHRQQLNRQMSALLRRVQPRERVVGFKSAAAAAADVGTSRVTAAAVAAATTAAAAASTGSYIIIEQRVMVGGGARRRSALTAALEEGRSVLSPAFALHC